MSRVRKLKARRAYYYRKIREAHRRPTKISKLRTLIRNKSISREERIIAIRKLKHIKMGRRKRKRREKN